jgi:hypothetical protein
MIDWQAGKNDRFRDGGPTVRYGLVASGTLTAMFDDRADYQCEHHRARLSEHRVNANASTRSHRVIHIISRLSFRHDRTGSEPGQPTGPGQAAKERKAVIVE